eukprot:2161867-Rhodomonas_salina.3
MAASFPPDALPPEVCSSMRLVSPTPDLTPKSTYTTRCCESEYSELATACPHLCPGLIHTPTFFGFATVSSCSSMRNFSKSRPNCRADTEAVPLPSMVHAGGGLVAHCDGAVSDEKHARRQRGIPAALVDEEEVKLDGHAGPRLRMKRNVETAKVIVIDGDLWAHARLIVPQVRPAGLTHHVQERGFLSLRPVIRAGIEFVTPVIPHEGDLSEASCRVHAAPVRLEARRVVHLVRPTIQEAQEVVVNVLLAIGCEGAVLGPCQHNRDLLRRGVHDASAGGEHVEEADEELTRVSQVAVWV